MWIRSQDKLSLRNYNGLFIDQTNKKVICGDSNDSSDSWFFIGTYTSEERALEVLNNIESILDNNLKTRVFDMPEE